MEAGVVGHDLAVTLGLRLGPFGGCGTGCISCEWPSRSVPVRSRLNSVPRDRVYDAILRLCAFSSNSRVPNFMSVSSILRLGIKVRIADYRG